MSVNLKTKCEECVHKKVCRNTGMAKLFSDKLKQTNYGDGPNDDYDYGIMSDHYHVNIDISCKDFERAKPVPRTPESKKSESTGWDHEPRFNSLDERDLYYK